MLFPYVSLGSNDLLLLIGKFQTYMLDILEVQLPIATVRILSTIGYLHLTSFPYIFVW